ncbi:MAG: hypothetical protein RLZZ546_2327 [Bacteroidota bacterium]|jgi:hypothetical protein
MLIGCRERHKYTREICGDNLYVEVYNINPAGVGRCYLTDSLNFKIEIGSYDEEHDQYEIDCKGDNINVIKETSGNKSAEWVKKNGIKSLKRNIDTIERKFYKLSDLQKLKNF